MKKYMIALLLTAVIVLVGTNLIKSLLAEKGRLQCLI